MVNARRVAGLLVAIAAGCSPEWLDDPAQIAAPRIIAVTVDPPEARPGDTIALAAVVATPAGPAAPPVEWAFCRWPKPLAENGPVHPACAASGDLPDARLSLGPSAPSITAAIPADACRLFGPETPPRMGTSPPARPRDPDSTGGYYQPIRAAGIGPAVLASVRIGCNLASAPLEVAADLRQRYRPNRNPDPPAILALVDGVPVPLAALPAGRPITLVAQWTPGSVERYLAFDPVSQTLVERREAMHLSWFTSGGTIAFPRTGRNEADPANDVVTSWRPDPVAPGATIHLWAVLQDNRGGTVVQYQPLTFR